MHYVHTSQAYSFEIQTYLDNSTIYRQITIYIILQLMYKILFLNYLYLLGWAFLQATRGVIQALLWKYDAILKWSNTTV